MIIQVQPLPPKQLLHILTRPPFCLSSHTMLIFNNVLQKIILNLLLTFTDLYTIIKVSKGQKGDGYENKRFNYK